jgi:hypothetical protein
LQLGQLHKGRVTKRETKIPGKVVKIKIVPDIHTFLGN